MTCDWGRWHELLDIRDGRGLTPGEETEYQRFARIVARLDVEAACDASIRMKRLVKAHERILFSIRRLTTALCLAKAKK